jgi:hypothetical protein
MNTKPLIVSGLREDKIMRALLSGQLAVGRMQYLVTVSIVRMRMGDMFISPLGQWSSTWDTREHHTGYVKLK